MSILVVLTNYRRPAQVAMAAEALMAQSVPCRIVVVDNHPLEEPESQLPAVVGAVAEDVWSMRENHGPPCRFAPALLDYRAEWVYFHDEDMLPGPRALEHFLATAERLGEHFATLGEVGRRFTPPGESQPMWAYNAGAVERGDGPVPVDMTARCHFVRRSDVAHALHFRESVLARVGAASAEAVGLHRHDDLLLCLGIQRATCWPSYLTADVGEGCSVRRYELPPIPAAHHRPTHVTERSRLIRRGVGVGWKRPWSADELEATDEPGGPHEGVCGPAEAAAADATADGG